MRTILLIVSTLTSLVYCGCQSSSTDQAKQQAQHTGVLIVEELKTINHLREKGELKDAFQSYEALVERFGYAEMERYGTDAQLALAIALKENGQTEQAEQILLLTTRSTASYLPAMLVLADLYRRTGRTPEAVSYFEAVAQTANAAPEIREAARAHLQELGIKTWDSKE